MSDTPVGGINQILHRLAQLEKAVGPDALRLVELRDSADAISDQRMREMLLIKADVLSAMMHLHRAQESWVLGKQSDVRRSMAAAAGFLAKWK